MQQSAAQRNVRAAAQQHSSSTARGGGGRMAQDEKKGGRFLNVWRSAFVGRVGWGVFFFLPQQKSASHITIGPKIPGGPLKKGGFWAYRGWRAFFLGVY